MLVYEGNQTAVRMLFVVTPVFEDILTRTKIFFKNRFKNCIINFGPSYCYPIKHCVYLDPCISLLCPCEVLKTSYCRVISFPS